MDISGKSFDRMSVSRRSFLHGDIISSNDVDHSTIKRRTKSRRPRNRRRNTLAGTDHKEIENALTAGYVYRTQIHKCDLKSALKSKAINLYKFMMVNFIAFLEIFVGGRRLLLLILEIN